ncbi:receptor-type tyrosine- phosphatase U-like protein [Labeo rohita]|nr:receptor-type tyrosine- phosphatase U-like protein [Labeo rohita]
MPHRGGRVAIFTAAQETLIVDMVRENNLIRLREIRDKVIADNVNFESIDDVSLATIDRVLRRQKMRMKQVYRVPFERNSARHKDLRYEYVQVSTSMFTVQLVDILCCSVAYITSHEYLFLDEAGFNLQKRRQRGHNIIGQRAITEVSGQRGGNITLCAAMGSEGLVHRHAVLGSYNTQRLLTFLEELRDILLDRQQHHPGPAHHIYVIIWDNVHFHRTNQITEWFTTNSNQFLNVCLPPYSPFLNPVEEFFSSWRWKVYDRQPYTRENLLRAMELACVDIPVEAFQGWIRHSRAFFPRCLARDNIACDVDEVMWPDAAQRHDAAQ